MRHSIRSRKSERPEGPRRFSMKSPLLAALAACSICACDPKIPPKPELPKVPKTSMAVSKEEAPATTTMSMSRPAIAMQPDMDAPKPMAAEAKPAVKSGPAKKPEPKTAKPPCGAFCALHGQGYGEAAPILHRRVTQQRRKMKLTAEEGRLAASYLAKDLPSMPRSKALLKEMPRTAIELIRGVNERGVMKEDAEQMAYYLIRFLKSMRMKNLSTFDECISHMIGREWHQIDYSGEGMTWQGQRKMYNRKSPERMDWVKDIKKAVYLHRFFEIEHRMRYFRKLFAPAGRLPAAPKTE
ncbi:MAG: hypothetical protein AB1295_05700 [Candidatus Micrarchaeota archaeon]